MSNREIIAVVGATGAQGGGVVRAILEDKDSPFAARAITRKPGSDKARALADRGVEVVEADIDDVDSVARAFQGAHGAFCVTNFWEHFSPERETTQARNMAEAAKRAGVHHAIWSTLEDTRESVPLRDERMPTLKEKYKVPHLDAKGEADHAFTDLGVPTTFLLTSFYWDNLIGFGMGPRRGADGKLVFALPMGEKKLAGIAAEDIGRAAYGIFKAGPSMIGRRVGIAGEHLTGAQMAETLSKKTGEPVTYYPVPFDDYRRLGFPGADDLGNMFQYFHDFAVPFLARRDVEGTRQLDPQLQSFEQFVAAHEIPIGS
jgi:uncharacterized protein YbjT (DUF2867 family)